MKNTHHDILIATPRLLILIQDGIVQPRLRICVDICVHKKKEIAVKSTNNMAESCTNDGGNERVS